MKQAESDRSVRADKDALIRLRKAQGLSIEAFARKCGIGHRTAQRLCAGEPVDLATIKAVADKMSVSVDSLLSGQKAPDVIHIHIDISIGGPEAVAKLKGAISLLQSLLPDNTGICVIGVVGGIAVIGVGKTAANESVLAAKEVLGTLGASKVSASFEIPRLIEQVGGEPPMDWVEDMRTHYWLTHGGTKDAWLKLTDLERLDFAIVNTGARIAEAEQHAPILWKSITPESARHVGRMTAQEQYDFSSSELERIRAKYKEVEEVFRGPHADEWRELQKLGWQSRMRFQLEQLQQIKASLEESFR